MSSVDTNAAGEFDWVAPPERRDLVGTFADDALARTDLDEVMPGFVEGQSLLWAAALQLATPGPPAETVIEGVDWQFSVPPDGFAAPGFDPEGGRADVRIGFPAAVISVATGAHNLGSARDVGRARLRALIGYLRLRTPLVIGARMVWEGPASRTETATLRLGSGATQVSLKMSQEGVEQVRDAVQVLDLSELVDRHRMALEWLSESWQANSTPVKFVNLWFAVVTTVDPTFTESHRRQTTQIQRIGEYLLLLPISTMRRGALKSRFESAYKLRNRIVHDGERDCVSQDALQLLYDAVSEFLLVDLHRT